MCDCVPPISSLPLVDVVNDLVIINGVPCMFFPTSNNVIVSRLAMGSNFGKAGTGWVASVVRLALDG